MQKRFSTLELVHDMMFNKTISLFITALLTALMGAHAFAAKPEIYSHRTKGAIKGYDVVAYYSLPEGAKAVRGSKKFTYEYKGALWKFSSEENKQAFIYDPERYIPQYGGYCAFAVSHGFVTSPRPHSWKIVDGKLYLNNNKKSFEKWVVDMDNKIVKADKNWPTVLGGKKSML